MDEGTNRFTTTFSTILQQQTRQLQERIDTFSTSIERFSERFSEVIYNLVGGISTSGETMPESVGGVQLVRIVNEPSQPIPVSLPDGKREESRGGGGFLSGLLGGIGSFFGGIFSGLFAPVTGALAGAELIFALREAFPLVQEARELVADMKTLGQELVTSISELILLLFDELYSAGIFPVSRLIASILILIDTGITLILTHIEPIIDWIGSVLEALTTWLDRFINSLSRWLDSAINIFTQWLENIIDSLTRWIDDLLNSVRWTAHNIVRDAIRSLVDSLITVFSGLFMALGTVIIESFTWAGEWIAYMVSTSLNKLPFVDINVRRPEPIVERISQGVRRSFRDAGEFGQIISEGLLGPAPRPSPTPHAKITAPTPRGTPKGTTENFTIPRPPTMPRIGIQPLEIPEIPLSEPILERILEAPQRMSFLPSGVTPIVVKPSVPEGPAPITVNGDVNVQITAQTIDRENAGETARLIAENVLEEIQRLTELERFRYGLSTMTNV